MKKVTLIIGEKKSGKTTKMFEIIGDRSFLGVEPEKLFKDQYLTYLAEKHEGVYFDECGLSTRQIKRFIREEGNLYRLDVIIVLQKNEFSKLKISLLPHVRIIDMEVINESLEKESESEPSIINTHEKFLFGDHFIMEFADLEAFYVQEDKALHFILNGMECEFGDVVDVTPDYFLCKYTLFGRELTFSFFYDQLKFL